MAQDELRVHEAGPSWLGRLVSPGSGRPGTVPFLLMALSVVAYVLSLALDWVVATAKFTTATANASQLTFITLYGAKLTSDRQSATTTVTAAGNVTGLELMGLVYGLGGLAMLMIGFAVLSRPELALRLRMGAAGLSVGLLGIVVAAALKLPNFLLIGGASYSNGSLEEMRRSFQPGIVCAAAFAVLPLVAVWVRSRPAAQAANASATPATQDPAAPVVGQPTPAYDPSVWDRLYSDPTRWRRSGLPPALDLTVTPDD